MKGSDLSQNKQVLSHLSSHVGITAKEAFLTYGIERLSARIHDLRSKGYNISSVEKTSITRLGRKCRYVEYRLVG